MTDVSYDHLKITLQHEYKKPCMINISRPDEMIIFRAILTDYSIRDGVDSKIVKTIDKSLYLYLFGDAAMQASFSFLFSDGTSYLKYQEDDYESQKRSVFDFINSRAFYPVLIKGKYKPVMISFNTVTVYMYILSADVAGSANQPWLATVNLTGVISDIKKRKDYNEAQLKVK